MKIKLSDIIIPKGRRSVDYDKVSQLAESISIIGLLNPITVNKNNILVAGVHRFEAYKLLGLKEIECIVLDCDELCIELAEIDENFCRNDLDAISIGELAIRRDEILDLLKLRAKVGDNQHSKRGSADSALPKTTQDIADEVGISNDGTKRNNHFARFYIKP